MKIEEVMDMVREQIDLAAKNRDRSVYLSVTEYGTTVIVEPWPGEPEKKGEEMDGCLH